MSLSLSLEPQSPLMTLLSLSVVGAVMEMYVNMALFLSEPIEVGYDPVSYVTTESTGFVDLTIRVFSHPGGSPRPFSLAINTEDGTASKSQIS